MMELGDLRTFAAAVEAGNMTRAAHRLHVVQSTVSQAVKRLERQAGVPLLERGPGGIRPTEAGTALAQHAKVVLNAVARAEADMAAYRGLGAGTVDLGVPHTAAPLLLAPLLRLMRARHPGLRVRVEEAMVGQIEERLRDGRLDLGIVYFPVDFSELEVRWIASVPLWVAAAPDHRLAGRRRVRVAELAGESWVSFPLGEPARGWLDDACAAAGFPPRIEVEVETFAQMKVFVEAGLGIAMLPPRSAEAERRAGALHLLEATGPAPAMTVGYAYDARQPGRALAAVREVLEEVVRAAGRPPRLP